MDKFMEEEVMRTKCNIIIFNGEIREHSNIELDTVVFMKTNNEFNYNHNDM